MFIRILTVVRSGDTKHKPGSIVDLPEAVAIALKAEGSAEAIEPETEAAAVGSAESPATESLATESRATESPVADEELAHIAKALETQYLKPELIERAKAVGVEFPYDATKPTIISAILAQGKADAVLK